MKLTLETYTPELIEPMTTLIPELKPRLSLNLASVICERNHRLRLQHFTRCQPATSEFAAPPCRWTSRCVCALLLTLFALSFAPQVNAADPLATWTPRTSPYGTTNNWRAIAFGNG